MTEHVMTSTVIITVRQEVATVFCRLGLFGCRQCICTSLSKCNVCVPENFLLSRRDECCYTTFVSCGPTTAQLPAYYISTICRQSKVGCNYLLAVLLKYQPSSCETKKFGSKLSEAKVRSLFDKYLYGMVQRWPPTNK